jgi:hypothetical protein
MKTSIKLSVILIACFSVLSTTIYSGFAVPNLQIMPEDKIVIEPHTEHFDDIFPLHFTTNAKDILPHCGKHSGCIVNSLKYVSKNENKELVLETFSQINNSFLKTGQNCHSMGHPLGAFLYNYTGNLYQALLLADTNCGGSLYHGIMQEYFKTNLLYDGNTPTYIVASKECNELSSTSSSVTRFECAHGVGHGLVIAYDYDYLTAVKKCEEFEDGLAQLSCVEGSIMEDNSKRIKTYDDSNQENDIFFPCSKLEEKHAGPCYNYHGGYILKKVDGSEEEAFKQCEKIKNKKLLRHCYYGIGLWKGHALTENLEMILPLCQKGNLNYQKDCFSGAANIVTDQTGINQGIKLCKILPVMFKLDCFNTVGKWIHLIHTTQKEIEEECSQLKNIEYYQVCIDANPGELGQL